MNADDIVALEPYDYENKILAQWEDEGVLIVLRADSHKRRLKKDDFVTAIASWKDPAGNSKSFEGPYRIEFKDGNFALVQDWWAARYFDAKPKDADAIHAIAVVKRIIGEEAPAAAAAHKLKLVVARHRQELWLMFVSLLRHLRGRLVHIPILNTCRPWLMPSWHCIPRAILICLSIDRTGQG